MNKNKSNVNGTSINIPIYVKNIFSIEINRLILPSRFLYLKNGNFVNIVNLDMVSIVIEEFNNICYGSNNITNKTFCNMVPITSTYNNNIKPKFIEYKNINTFGKFFYPAHLNTINTLTFRFYNINNQELKYLNDSLTIKKISLLKNSNFLKIEFNEYFSQLNYRENDIIEFKVLRNLENNLLGFLLENKHVIHYENDFTPKKNLNVDDLVNNFYIKKQGDYNSSGEYTVNNLFNNTNDDQIINCWGNVLNLNLQIKIMMTIKTKEKDVIFKSELI